MNSVSIRRLQEQLRLIANYGNNLPSVAVDGIYGEETENAVRAFQQLFGLKATGKVDFDTLEAINEVYTLLLEAALPADSFSPYPDCGKVLRPGDRSPLVSIIQIMLNAIAGEFDNFRKVRVDGDFGSVTADNIRELQKVNQMEPTGLVNKPTWNALCRLYSRCEGDQC